ncbi:MAG: hypothetical protein COV32_02820 [Candidatus Yonathbacteria bacterium CG10_big_fil_rev_8_21_14_0_10_43_136]|nr:MAG: hypothetical protein COV32_02820 [Candidatus Yonathbacteria bacterium CG10_big_fil_rev_8_21_14_0_10_43_136]
MKTAMINIKTDKAVKEEAQKLAAELGFSLSALVTASLKQFVRTREVVIEEVEKDIKAKKNISPAFTNAREASAYLRKLA